MVDTLLRNVRINEAPLLTKIAARSKAHWPYDQAYLDLCNQVTRVDEGDILHWHFVVAEVESRVAGFAGVAPVKDEFMLDHLWIEPEFIGKGTLVFSCLFFATISVFGSSETRALNKSLSLKMESRLSISQQNSRLCSSTGV